MVLYKLFAIICIFFVNLSFAITKRIGLTPIKCPGIYQFSSGREINAIYLSKEKLEIIENDDTMKSTITLCDVVPILLSEDSLSVINYINNPSNHKNNINKIITRDNGIYDNIPYHWNKMKTKCKLELFNLISKDNFKSKSFIDQFHVFKNVLYEVMNMNITGLLLEVEDRYDDNLVSLGGAVVISKSEYAIDYMISKSNNVLPKDKEKLLEQACIVNCHLDELIGFAIALNYPIYINQQLFDTVSIDATLINPISSTDKSIVKLPSIFAKSKSISKTDKETNKEMDEDNSATTTLLPWQIYDPQVVLKLSGTEKRVLLRAAGVKALPRPREGIEALDRMFYDLLDEGVRDEVLRLQSLSSLSSNNGITNTQDVDDNKLIAANSSRQLLLQQISQALSKGNIEEAENLREQFILNTLSLADPTQQKGSYDPYLDQDDWYLLARKKAMEGKKPPKK